MELEGSYAEFRKRGLGVAAISSDSPEILKDFAGRRGITFPLLADPQSTAIRAFGVLNEAVPKDNPIFGIPHPVTFIVDRRGHVTSKFHEDDFRQRYTAAAILGRRFGVPLSAARSEPAAKHVKIATSASNGTVRAGQRVALVVELTLPNKMHVYAPGVEGYIPIDWKMTDSAAAKAGAVDYPASRKLHLKAIDETVPVYEKTVRLMRELVIATQPKALAEGAPGGELTVEGSFRYQACDDKQCFTPESVPLRWVFRVEANDTERVPPPLRKLSR